MHRHVLMPPARMHHMALDHPFDQIIALQRAHAVLKLMLRIRPAGNSHIHPDYNYNQDLLPRYEYR